MHHDRFFIQIGGDIIVEIDSIPVATLTDLLAVIEDNKPGDTVEVKIIRGHRKMSFNAELSKRPEDFRL
jgi:S1-C subfamily serine protease